MFPNIVGLYHLLFKCFLNIKSPEVNDFIILWSHYLNRGQALHLKQIILCDNISYNLTGMVRHTMLLASGQPRKRYV